MGHGGGRVRKVYLKAHDSDGRATGTKPTMTTLQPASLLSSASLREHDRPAVRTVALVRVLIATAAAIVFSLLDDSVDARTPLLWWIGLGWLPWSGIVAMAVERPNSLFTRVGGALGDIATVTVLAHLYPGRFGVALGYGLAIAVGAYTSSRLIGLGLTSISIGSLTAVQTTLEESERLSPTVIALGALAMLVLLALVDRASAIHRSAEEQSTQAQGRASAILAHVASSVVVTDRRGVITTTNPAAARMLAQPDANLTGHTCAALLNLHEGERPLDCSKTCALLGRDEPDGVELWRPRGDARQPILGSAEAVRDADGAIVEVVHSFRDITTLKQADEAKTLFLATASHELKTPLTVIRGFAETLRRVPDLPQSSRDAALEAIHRRAIELGDIVERLLLSSRIEAGRLDLLPTAVDVSELLSERLDAIRGATGREVITIVDERLPSVRGDTVAMATVVDHIVENAIKYSKDDTTVVVTAKVDDGDVVVTVSDSGIGMDGDQLAHCFDKFWQAESSDRRRYGGTGIGLYIVKSMVEAMGGTISVDSTVGKGTTFTIRLHIYVDVAGDVGGAGRIATRPEPSIVREFMRQLGIPTGGGGA